MLIPALAMKDELTKAFDLLRYTDRMSYYMGCIEDGRFWAYGENDYSEGNFQYAIVDSDKNLIGYIGYKVDYYSSTAYNFGLISFVEPKTITRTVISDDGKEVQRTIKIPNWNITLAITEVITQLESFNLHRIEFGAVSSNPIITTYDRIVSKYGKNPFFSVRKLVKLDTFRDRTGRYCDSYCYEIIKWNTITEKITNLEKVRQHELTVHPDNYYL